MKQFDVGDIVFVSDYEYKSGINGQNHIFVIIDDGQAIDFDYYYSIRYTVCQAFFKKSLKIFKIFQNA